MPSQPILPAKKQGDATPFLPKKPTITNLREAARSCKGCDLWKNATQTVFGEGDSRPSIMLIGEQPGDKEDIAGHPFVGPAGSILDEAETEKQVPGPGTKNHFHCRKIDEEHVYTD